MRKLFPSARTGAGISCSTAAKGVAETTGAKWQQRVPSAGVHSDIFFDLTITQLHGGALRSPMREPSAWSVRK